MLARKLLLLAPVCIFLIWISESEAQSYRVCLGDHCYGWNSNFTTSCDDYHKGAPSLISRLCGGRSGTYHQLSNTRGGSCGIMTGIVTCNGTAARPPMPRRPGSGYVVIRRFYCRDAQNRDVGDRTLTANGASCDLARRGIAAQAQGDVCRRYDQDWHTVGQEEIQISACPRQ